MIAGCMHTHISSKPPTQRDLIFHIGRPFGGGNLQRNHDGGVYLQLGIQFPPPLCTWIKLMIDHHPAQTNLMIPMGKVFQICLGAQVSQPACIAIIKLRCKPLDNTAGLVKNTGSETTEQKCGIGKHTGTDHPIPAKRQGGITPSELVFISISSAPEGLL